MSKILLECCVGSVESAVNAELGGAGRVELCAALELGGVTPSSAAIRLARERIGIPLFVLIRPRGGDFHYSPLEVEVMKTDIAAARDLGADGIVLGILREDGNVDVERTAELIEAAGGASITFHRAFDSTPDPLAALETLRELGVNRVLTTGGARRAEEGLAGLGKLVEAAAGRIGILPGGGINHENCRQVVEQTGAREIHVGSAVCSAGPRQEASGLGPGGIETPAPGGETDPESVRRLLDLLG
ncbi:MAG: copper homeostasis protein CutC [Planctomycetota bacterium]|nr:copper homeostasis protein CutC [Planctomycetota bacterium]